MDLTTTPTISIAPSSPTSPLQQIAKALSGHKLLFAVVATTVTAICGAYVYTLQPRYTAVASVLVHASNGDPLAASSNTPQAQLDETAATNEAMLLKSRDTARDIVERMGFAAEPPPVSAPLRAFCRAVGPVGPCASLDAPPSLEARVSLFQSRLQVATQPRSRVLEVRFETGDPVEAAEAVNGLISAVQQREIAQQAESLERTANWLEGRTQDLRVRWITAQEKVGTFSAVNGLTQNATGRTGSPLIGQQVAEAASSLSTAQADLSAAEARAAQAKSQLRGADPQALIKLADNPVLVAAAADLVKLRNQQADLAQRHGPNHPALAAINAQIGATEKKVVAETNSSLRAIQDEVSIRRRQVDQLAANLARLRTRSDALGVKEVELRTLDHEAAAAKSVYESFLERARQIADRTSLLQPAIQFVSRATPPERPSFPSRQRFLVAGLFAGLCCGAGAAMAREFLRRGFVTLRQVSEQIPVPLLATIPNAGPWRRGEARDREVIDRPFSATAEAIRSLAAQIALATRARDLSHAVTLTSAVGSEGKSTTALWLASAAAQSGQKVLLIDADQGRGTLGASLAAADAPGWTDALRGRVPFADTIQKAPGFGFDVIATGARMQGTIGPADLRRLQAGLEGLKSRYALIIIDTPPLLAASDALIYASLADQTIFLCRWQSTSRDAVVGGLERLRAAGAPMLGVVLSMVDQARISHLGDVPSRREAKYIARHYHHQGGGAPERVRC